MGKIDFHIMEIAALELVREAQMASAVQKQTEHLLDEGRCAYLQGQGGDGTSDLLSFESLPAAARLKEAAAVLETEAEALKRGGQALHNIIVLYRQAQQRVNDTIYGEVTVLPRTEFGTSRFENLQEFEHLIPVSARNPAENREQEMKNGSFTAGDNAVLSRIL